MPLRLFSGFAVFVWVVVFGIGDVFAQITHKEVKRIAASQVKSGEVGVQEPILKIEGGSLSWFGPYVLLDLPPHPASAAIEAQYDVEAIRHTRSKHKQRRFWKEPLAKVESLIQEELDYISRTENPNEEKLWEFGRQRQAIYDSVIAEFAKKRGLNLDVNVAARSFEIVHLDPNAPGIIYLISFAKYQISKILYSREPPLTLWTAYQPNSEAELAGKYYYTIKQRDGSLSQPRATPKITSKIDILRLP